MYFNHASFASLRRQLSYFSFVRVGRSRQSDAAYVNRNVVDLSDILKLRRRPGLRRPSAGEAGGGGVVLHGRSDAVAPSSSSSGMREEEDVPTPRHRGGDPPSSVSADVASAVLSGTLHAAKANHNLEANDGGVGGTTGTTIATSSKSHPHGGERRSTVTSYADSSMSQSSDNDASKDAPSNKEGDVDDCDDGTRKDATVERGGRGKRSIDNDGRRRKRAAVAPSSSFAVKRAIPRKDRARFRRMLSVNAIVPFIHLPPGRASRGKGKSTAVVHDPVRGGGGEIRMGMVDVDAAAARESAAMLIDSDAAINALLALGSDCQ